MQQPQIPENMDSLSGLSDAYRRLGKQIEFKDRHEWDSMSVADFQAYDAVIITGLQSRCPSYDPGNYYDPISNYENWGLAIRNGNSVILGTENILPSNATDLEDMLIMHAAASYSISKPENTGAYISVGRMYNSCIELNSTWLDVVFDVEKEEGRFRLVPNDKNDNEMKNTVVVDKNTPPTLVRITEPILNRNEHTTSLAMFTKYPPNLRAFAVSSEYFNLPFILYNIEVTASPSPAPVALPPKDVLIFDYNPTSTPSIFPTSSCPNNSTFYINGDVTKTCKWVGLDETRRAKQCEKLNVQRECPQTCDVPCPTMKPSKSPSSVPTKIPSQSPSPVPTKTPSQLPSQLPSSHPSKNLTSSPTKVPTLFSLISPPTRQPSVGTIKHGKKAKKVARSKKQKKRNGTKQ